MEILMLYIAFSILGFCLGVLFMLFCATYEEGL